MRKKRIRIVTKIVNPPVGQGLSQSNCQSQMIHLTFHPFPYKLYHFTHDSPIPFPQYPHVTCQLSSLLIISLSLPADSPTPSLPFFHHVSLTAPFFSSSLIHQQGFTAVRPIFQLLPSYICGSMAHQFFYQVLRFRYQCLPSYQKSIIKLKPHLTN